MYFWRMRALKKQLIEQGLTERQIYLYVLISVALTAFGVEVMGYCPYETPDFWIYANSALNICVPIIGTVVVFRANGGDSGVKFAERYFSIGLVAGVRFLVLLILLAIAFFTYMFATEKEISTSGIVVTIVDGAWYVALYAYIAKQVYDVAQEKPVQSDAAKT